MEQAVIGAGAAGLVAVRELLREGHAVTAFEAGSCCGGTWRYTPEVEGDLLGQGSARRRVHSSMYRWVAAAPSDV
jgi:cation diffusion facilitator CzcD-associated flavoprotein CzcO